MEKKNLIIISAGALGREICHMAGGAARVKIDSPWETTGFLDDRKGILKNKDAFNVPILSSVEEYEPQPEDRFISAIGSPSARTHYAEMIRKKGGEFTCIISNRAVVTRRKHILPGCVIGPFCVLSSDLKIGKDTFLMAHVTLGHDVELGDSCHVGAYTFIGGRAKIGNQVTIHPHSCILPDTVVEEGATVGAGSVVISRVPAGETVFGVPARIVRT